MPEDEPESELIDLDEAEYSLKSEFSKPLVIQTQVMRCNELRSKEMVEGHTIRTFDKAGNYKIVDIPDTRQPFIGGVIVLRTNLTPEIIRQGAEQEKDKDIKINIKSIDEDIKKVFNKYKHKEIALSWEDKRPILIYSGNEYMPKKGAILTVGITKGSGKPPSENRVEGYWDNKVNAYWDKMILLYDKLYAQLNILIDLNDYFKPVSGW